METELEVQCYSGYQGEERPVRFRLGEEWHEVREILDRWYGPESRYFKLKSDDGHVYIVSRSQNGVWRLESFRAESVH